MNWKESGRKPLFPNRGTLPEFLEGLRKNMKISEQLVSRRYEQSSSQIQAQTIAATPARSMQKMLLIYCTDF
jgi:hypothetical protein